MVPRSQKRLSALSTRCPGDAFLPPPISPLPSSSQHPTAAGSGRGGLPGEHGAAWEPRSHGQLGNGAAAEKAFSGQERALTWIPCYEVFSFRRGGGIKKSPKPKSNEKHRGFFIAFLLIPGYNGLFPIGAERRWGAAHLECGQNKYNLCLRLFGICPLQKLAHVWSDFAHSPRSGQRQAAAACGPFASGRV